MGHNSKIEWTHHTFNPWRGCTKVSDGCKNCYADVLSARNPKSLGVWGPAGTRVIAAESYWRQPLGWNEQARRYPDECAKCGQRLNAEAQAGIGNTHCPSRVDGEGKFDPSFEVCGGEIKVNVRPRVFCASLADVFEGPETMPADARQPVADARARLFDLIYKTKNLDWLILTKRPENIDAFIGGTSGAGLAEFENLYPNVWLGTSVENRKTCRTRIGPLRNVPAAVRFLSIEPLIEDVGELDLTGIHWVIVGGESGHHARPMKPQWSRDIRDQCVAAGIAFHFKQHGEWCDYSQCGASGWQRTNPWKETVRGVITDSDNRKMFDGREFETRYPWMSESDVGPCMVRVGKKLAGRSLDGRIWDEFPQPTTKSIRRSDSIELTG